MILKEYNIELFADHFQFYLQDEKVSGDLSNAWSEEASSRLLAVSDGTMGIGTVRNMDVMVSIRFHDMEPTLLEESDSIHQMNECDIEIESGKLVVAGCTDYFPDALRIETERGTYRARIYYKDLDKLSDDGLDGEDNYEIHLWPSLKQSGVKIVKSRKKSA